MDSRNPSVGRSETDDSLLGVQYCGQIDRPAFFDLLFLSTPSSPVGSSLPLTEANIFADALGVAPVYRQKESKRWSSALQLYRQMSSHDIAERSGLSSSGTTATNSAACGGLSSQTVAVGVHEDGEKCDKGAAVSDASALHSRSQTMPSGMTCQEDASNPSELSKGTSNLKWINENQMSGSSSGNLGNRDRSQETSGDCSPGESSLNSLELEAIAAVHELHFAVRDISVSDLLPRTSELIFLNVTTLEGQAYCVELTAKGWRVTSLRHDCMNGDLQHLHLHTIYFETIYSLMDTISACYRQRFTDLLALRLRQLQALSESSSQLFQVPEVIADPTAPDNVLMKASAEMQKLLAKDAMSKNNCEGENSEIIELIQDGDDYEVPITIHVPSSSSAGAGVPASNKAYEGSA